MSEQTAETPKPKRAYTRRARTETPTVHVAEKSPAVTALEGQVLELVAQRIAANREIVQAVEASSQASARVTAAQQNLRQLESEVQYRLGLIQQMQGVPQRLDVSGSAYVPTIDHLIPSGGVNFSSQASELNGMGVSVPAGVSSIPAPAQPLPFTSGTRVRGPRSESAEGFRAEEIGVRAAI